VTEYRGELLSDPSLKSYNILGFTSGIGKVMGLKALSRGITAMRAGYRPGTIQGSTLQVGGAVIINPDATVSYFFASTEAGDHPPISDLLGALSSQKKG
jgi:hypothetical protein